ECASDCFVLRRCRGFRRSIRPENLRRESDHAQLQGAGASGNAVCSLPDVKSAATACKNTWMNDPAIPSLEHGPDPKGRVSAKCEAVFPRDKRGTRLRGDHAQTKS